MPRPILLATLALLTFSLAACGTDGDPQPPTKSGITVSGEAQIGVVVK